MKRHRRNDERVLRRVSRRIGLPNRNNAAGHLGRLRKNGSGKEKKKEKKMIEGIIIMAAIVVLAIEYFL